MGSKLTKQKKKGSENDGKNLQTEKDAAWTTSTWPRNKKPNFNEKNDETLGQDGTATLGRGTKLKRKPSLSKRMRVSARNWAATKGIIDPCKSPHNHSRSEAPTKPSSVVLGENEAKTAVVEEVLEKVDHDNVEVQPEISPNKEVDLVVEELVTEAVMERFNEPEDQASQRAPTEIPEIEDKPPETVTENASIVENGNCIIPDISNTQELKITEETTQESYSSKVEKILKSENTVEILKIMESTKLESATHSNTSQETTKILSEEVEETAVKIEETLEINQEESKVGDVLTVDDSVQIPEIATEDLHQTPKESDELQQLPTKESKEILQEETKDKDVDDSNQTEILTGVVEETAETIEEIIEMVQEDSKEGDVLTVDDSVLVPAIATEELDQMPTELDEPKPEILTGEVEETIEEINEMVQEESKEGIVLTVDDSVLKPEIATEELDKTPAELDEQNQQQTEETKEILQEETKTKDVEDSNEPEILTGKVEEIAETIEETRGMVQEKSEEEDSAQIQEKDQEVVTSELAEKSNESDEEQTHQDSMVLELEATEIEPANKLVNEDTKDLSESDEAQDEKSKMDSSEPQVKEINEEMAAMDEVHVENETIVPAENVELSTNYEENKEYADITEAGEVAQNILDNILEEFPDRCEKGLESELDQLEEEVTPGIETASTLENKEEGLDASETPENNITVQSLETQVESEGATQEMVDAKLESTDSVLAEGSMENTLKNKEDAMDASETPEKNCTAQSLETQVKLEGATQEMGDKKQESTDPVLAEGIMEDCVEQEKHGLSDGIKEESEHVTTKIQDPTEEENTSVTNEETLEVEKPKQSHTELEGTTVKESDVVSDDGSVEERTDVSTDEGIVASSDDEKNDGANDMKDKITLSETSAIAIENSST